MLYTRKEASNEIGFKILQKHADTEYKLSQVVPNSSHSEEASRLFQALRVWLEPGRPRTFRRMPQLEVQALTNSEAIHLRIKQWEHGL